MSSCALSPQLPKVLMETNKKMGAIVPQNREGKKRVAAPPLQNGRRLVFETLPYTASWKTSLRSVWVARLDGSCLRQKGTSLSLKLLFQPCLPGFSVEMHTFPLACAAMLRARQAPFFTPNLVACLMLGSCQMALGGPGGAWAQGTPELDIKNSQHESCTFGQGTGPWR